MYQYFEIWKIKMQVKSNPDKKLPITASRYQYFPHSPPSPSPPSPPSPPPSSYSSNLLLLASLLLLLHKLLQLELIFHHPAHGVAFLKTEIQIIWPMLLLLLTLSTSRALHILQPNHDLHLPAAQQRQHGLWQCRELRSLEIWQCKWKVGSHRKIRISW